MEMCEHPAVTLQILPFSAGAHRAMGGPFTILRYTEPDLRDVVFIEQLTSALYLDKTTEVDSYLEVIEEVCLQAESASRTPGLLKDALDAMLSPPALLLVYSSGTRVGVTRVRVSLRKNGGLTTRMMIPPTRPATAERNAITKTPPMYQCGQNGISQDV
jgi:hypothetical protein